MIIGEVQQTPISLSYIASLCKISNDFYLGLSISGQALKQAPLGTRGMNTDKHTQRHLWMSS